MRLLGRNLADLIGGLAVAALGAAAVWEASGYPIGRLTRIGPGYFPLLLGGVLIVLGIAIVVMGRRTDTALPAVPLRAVVAVSGAMLAFGLLILRTGIAPATFALVLIASLAERPFRPVRALILAAGLTVFAYLVFIQALGLPLRLFWWR